MAKAKQFKPRISSPVLHPAVQLACFKVFRRICDRLKLVKLKLHNERGMMLIGYSPRAIITQQIGQPTFTHERFTILAEGIRRITGLFDDVSSIHFRNYYDALHNMTRDKDFVFLASMSYEDFVDYYSGALLQSTSRVGAYYIHPFFNTIYRCIFAVSAARKIVLGHKFSSPDAFKSPGRYPRNVVVAEDFVDRVLYVQIDYRSSQERRIWPRYHLFCNAIPLKEIKIVPKTQRFCPIETEYDLRVWQDLIKGAMYRESNALPPGE
jgi:hypothetical protein